MLESQRMCLRQKRLLENGESLESNLFKSIKKLNIQTISKTAKNKWGHMGKSLVF